MKIIRIPITESKHTAQAKLFNKLPMNAKKLFILIARSGRDEISIDDIRNTGIFGATFDIEQILYTLESRGFGVVKVKGAEIYFSGNKILMQSVL